MKNWFIPNSNISMSEEMRIKCIWILFGLFFWLFSPFSIIPPMGKVFGAFPLLIKEELLFVELLASAKLYFHSILITIGVSALVSYGRTIPFLKFISEFFALLRTISVVGLLVIFTVFTANGYWLKVTLLVFCMAPWLIASMNDIIERIPHEKYEYARTLKLNELLVTWHVVIRGTLHQVLDAFKQVALMGVVLLPVAERLARSDGGIGAVLASLERFQRLDKIWALDLIIFCYAIGQDYFLSYLRKIICPYSDVIEKGK